MKQDNNYIYVHAYRNKWLPFTFLIRTKSNSKIDHVSLEIPKYGIYQSRLFEGVTCKAEQHQKPYLTLKLPFDKNSVKGKQLIMYLNECVGRGYDYKAAIFGFWGIGKCDSKNRWYCSELTDLYFSLYLGQMSSLRRTNIFPKGFIAKCEAFLLGIEYE